MVKDYLWLHFVVLIWGFTAILGLLISLPAVEIVFYRTLLASIGLLLFLKFRRRPLKVSGSALTNFLLTGGLIGHIGFCFSGQLKFPQHLFVLRDWRLARFGLH